jgi:hypothetical protein
MTNIQYEAILTNKHYMFSYDITGGIPLITIIYNDNVSISRYMIKVKVQLMHYSYMLVQMVYANRFM